MATLIDPKFLHGLLNLIVLVLFIYQGRLGFVIRRARLSQGPFPLAAVRRHRKSGPRLTALGVIGFLFGFILVLLEFRKLSVFRAHLSVGLAIVLVLLATYAMTRRIKGPASPVRTPHFLIGTAMIALYIVQTVIGLDILF